MEIVVESEQDVRRRLDDAWRKSSEDRVLVARMKLAPLPARAVWDVTAAAIRHIDITDEIVTSGVLIFRGSTKSVVAGLCDAAAYERNTLWNDCHDDVKTARVIDAWSRGVALSPPFLVRHGTADCALVSDGRHRLTVARAIGAPELAFIVPARSSEWIALAFPSVQLLCKVGINSR